MPIIGYALSAIVPNVIEWFCMEKMLHRKNISTPVMVILAITSGVLITLQTQFAYSIVLNSIVSVVAIFLFTFCYRESWVYRLFIALSLYVIAVIAEGSGFLIARFFITVDMLHANTNAYFSLIALVGVLMEIPYIAVAWYIIKSYKKRSPRMTTFILFLIVVLAYCIIDLLVTFADTAYLFVRNLISNQNSNPTFSAKLSRPSGRLFI